VKRIFYSLLIAATLIAPSHAYSSIDDALSFAFEAASPYVKDFTVREDYWGGDLPVKTTKAIVHQLFKGNEYWFWMGTDEKTAKISVHVYDSEGTSPRWSRSIPPRSPTWPVPGSSRRRPVRII
jgi:hypothetical protein